MATPAEDGMPLGTRAWALERLKIEEAEKILQQIEQEKGMQAEAAAQAEQAPPAVGPDGQPQAPPPDPLAEVAALFEPAAQ